MIAIALRAVAWSRPVLVVMRAKSSSIKDLLGCVAAILRVRARRNQAQGGRRYGGTPSPLRGRAGRGWRRDSDALAQRANGSKSAPPRSAGAHPPLQLSPQGGGGEAGPRPA